MLPARCLPTGSEDKGDTLLSDACKRECGLQANSSNKLLELRGNAGSHDTELARDTFEALHAAKADNAKVGIVRYDKSMHQGRGDRAAPEKWQYVQGPVDVVLFEGWMLGFAPLSEEEAQKVRGTCCGPVELFSQEAQATSLCGAWCLAL